MAVHIRPTGREVFFPSSELIVSKTDLKGRITYANRTFCRIAGYAETELLGQPHSIIRHPDMPRAVFRLVWETIAAGREIFGYVKNMARSGDHYWVFAHITPSFDDEGKITSYHSNRRAPERSVIENAIAPLYAEVLRIENSHANGKDAVEAGTRALVDFVGSKKVSYDELMFALANAA